LKKTKKVPEFSKILRQNTQQSKIVKHSVLMKSDYTAEKYKRKRSLDLPLA